MPVSVRTHPRAFVWLMVFVPLAVLFGVTTTAVSYHLSPDPIAAGEASWSLAQHGTLNLRGQHIVPNLWLLKHGSELLSNRSPGVIASGLPAAWVDSLFQSRFTLLPERMTGALVTAAAVGVMALLLLELGATRRQAVGFALLAGVSTGTWAVSADGQWTHGPDQLLLLLALLALMRRHLWLAGTMLGLAVTVRTHLVLVAAVIGLGLSWDRRSLRPALALGVPSALGLAAILAYSKEVWGIWSLSPGYAAYGQPTTSQVVSSTVGWTDIQNVLGTFFSPDRGIFVLSPVLLILFLRFRPAWRTADAVARWAFVGGVLYMAVQLRLNPFTGGYNFFGYRLTLESLTLSVPLLFLGWRDRVRGSDWDRAVWAMLWPSIAVQVLGSTFITARGVEPYWRHSYILNTLDGEAYPVACKLLLVGALLAAAASMLIRRDRTATRLLAALPS